MLEPREADIPVLFLVLVVLPLVAYILLGKWSEAAKKRERINFLAKMAAEEAFSAQEMPTADAIPLVSTSKNGIHVCARCFCPAKTRCSRCKSVRYCSGRCQIIHWRRVHKQECQQSETINLCSSLNATTLEGPILEKVSTIDNLNSFYPWCNVRQALLDNVPSNNAIHPSITNEVSGPTNCSAVDASQEDMLHKRSIDKQFNHKPNKEMLRRQDMAALGYLEEASGVRSTNLTSNDTSNVFLNGQDGASTMHMIHRYSPQLMKAFESRSKYGDFTLNGGNVSSVEKTFNDETVESNCSYDEPDLKVCTKGKCALKPAGTKIYKSSKSMVRVFGEQSYSKREGSGEIADDSKVVRIGNAAAARGSSRIASVGIMKMMGLRKSTELARQDIAEFGAAHKKMTMLFPYEEFTKIFNCEVVNLSPRGLLNCGNSCYANAVLQCLTCTKPLIVFLLQKSHSRACYGKDWCLMCELEKHVMMLRESGGPLSLSRILLHMRNINCLIGDGSQEDAHEFLRLLVASMQSICLEGLGGEDKVNPIVQETTFIQHTFGGRLRSKVKCLRCHHESEQCESIMDLTLEIFGWVESLEDALTQFTAPEDLDGENMYRCGRCATYVRARKQLSIHEAPNILTIVLKRFQEGKYGKINKCITFPDMLDMIPFMTGTGDIPPLYVLYAVVVHLDSLNASFSGHYVAYVKDLQGKWFRVDDTEVHSVPMSQVMSEGAYILFYIRSCPRPEIEFYEKAVQQQVPATIRRCTSSRTQKPSRKGHSKSSSHFLGPESLSDLKTENTPHCRSGNDTKVMEFSDVTSSDWSLFTSSDEASFTTESTGDSFSTVDYTDTCNGDTFSSIFSNLYPPQLSSQNALCRRTFSNSRSQTRFIPEERGYMLNSYLSTQPPNVSRKGDGFEHVSGSSAGCPIDSHCTRCLNYGLRRTSSHCKL